MAALGLTVLPMPSDSACHHPHYLPQRNRIRTRQEPGRLRYRSQPPASWEVGNFQQHSTDAAPLYISSSAAGSTSCLTSACHSKYHLPRKRVCSITITRHNRVMLWTGSVMDIATVFRVQLPWEESLLSRLVHTA